MNRIQTNLGLLFAALTLAACGGQKAPAEATDTTELKGTYLVNYYVNVSRPTGGTIRSADGRINCGTLGGPNNACSPALYTWNQSITLTAIPDANLYFQSWAADCKGSVTDGCVLDTVNGGADKWVVAVFNPPERLGHGDITSPSLHAPKYFAFLGNDPGAPRCTNCHGQNYAGQSIAPSCNACHAAAGWANWQQSCSFCHGTKNATTKAGYVFAEGQANQEWAAPPDDVNGRLTGTSGAAVGAHQAHVAPNEFRSPVACSECHVVPTTAIHFLNHSLDLPFGPLSQSQGAVPQWDAATLTCSANYCHGNFTYGSVQGKAASLSWGGSLTGCTTCHDMPPAGHAYSANPDPVSCASCHPDTVLSDGTIDLAKGRHINGEKDASGGACDSCHWFPNSATRLPTGAHLAHYGLATTDGGGSGFGDLQILEDKFPTATPTTAPAKYAFGCGNCHPMDMAQHSMGSGSSVAKVFLYEAGAPADSLKSKNAPSAAYDATAKTCSGVYCHSSGQEIPTYVVSPAWDSGTKLGCSDCHANPPKYPSGGPGGATANSHVQLDNESTPYPWGHFGLPMTNASHPQHGQGTVYDYWTGQTYFSDAAPMTCQTCHAETTDPLNTVPGGFYYLDTTGDYNLPNGWGVTYACTTCHDGTRAPQGTGKVLPLRHVNGSRDVAFDARTGNPGATAPPGTADDPLRPYWITNGSTSNAGWPNTNVTFVGTTAQWDLSPARYNAADKTCTNVTCHQSQGNTSYTGTGPNGFFKLQWGTTYYYDGTVDPATGVSACSACHRY